MSQLSNPSLHFQCLSVYTKCIAMLRVTLMITLGNNRQSGTQQYICNVMHSAAVFQVICWYTWQLLVRVELKLSCFQELTLHTHTEKKRNNFLPRSEDKQLQAKNDRKLSELVRIHGMKGYSKKTQDDKDNTNATFVLCWHVHCPCHLLMSMCSASNLSNHALQAALQLLSFIHAGKQQTLLAERSAELELLKQNLGFRASSEVRAMFCQHYQWDQPAWNGG